MTSCQWAGQSLFFSFNSLPLPYNFLLISEYVQKIVSCSIQILWRLQLMEVYYTVKVYSTQSICNKIKLMCAGAWNHCFHPRQPRPLLQLLLHWQLDRRCRRRRQQTTLLSAHFVLRRPRWGWWIVLLAIRSRYEFCGFGSKEIWL